MAAPQASDDYTRGGGMNPHPARDSRCEIREALPAKLPLQVWGWPDVVPLGDPPREPDIPIGEFLPFPRDVPSELEESLDALACNRLEILSRHSHTTEP